MVLDMLLKSFCYAIHHDNREYLQVTFLSSMYAFGYASELVQRLICLSFSSQFFCSQKLSLFAL